jgi:amidase
MKRRTFLATTTLASAGLSTVLSSCINDKKNDDKAIITPAALDFELDEETIRSLRQN